MNFRVTLLTRWRALFTVAFALTLAGRSVVAQPDGPRVAIVDADHRPVAAIAVEVADTEGKRRFGLMYRKHLDENAGMIFVFARPQHLSFWMKHTEIPLDMIFADANGRIVGIVENAAPLSERLLSVAGDAQYVLEVNGHFCRRHGVKAGDVLKFAGFTPAAKD